MEKIKVALLAVLAVLILVQIVDRSRETAQMAAIAHALEGRGGDGGGDADLKARLADLASAVHDLAQHGVVAAPNDGTSKPAVAAGDGKVKLGANFLLPYDRSYFHPEWVGGTFREFDESPKGLNQILEHSTTTADVHKLISDRLCIFDPVHPELWRSRLAESAVISDDYTVYTFTIRKGVKWQRPSIAKEPRYKWLDQDVELTADDFAFYLQLIQDPNVECPHLKESWQDLAKAEAVDRYTLRLTWKRKVYISVEQSLFECWPSPRHVYGRNADGTPIPPEQVGIVFNKHWFDEARQAIGVGAYRLDANEPDKVIRFVRNPDYWGAGMHFDAIEWDCQTVKPDAELVGFKNGQAQILSMSPSQYKSEIIDRNEPRFAAPDPADRKAGRKGPFGWERIKVNAFYYLGWNMRTPLFSDKRVRQAMTCAFPKQRLIDEVYYGLGQPVLSSVHIDNPYYNRDLKPYPFDLAKAKALLADAGWVDSDGDGWLDKEVNGARKPFRFLVKYYANSPEWDRTLLIFRDELKKIGVELVPQSYEWKELLRIYEERDFDAMVGGWRDDSLEVDFYGLWHSSQADVPDSSNHCGYKNPVVDQLAEQLRVTFDLDERIRIARQIQAIIHEDQPYTFFKSSEGILAWQNLPLGPDDKRPTLDGLIQSFDLYHPLFRSRGPWHFRK